VTASIGGPGATTRATARALTKVADARTLVLVEGVSDEIAVETAAAALGRDLAAERLVVVPIGGAHAIRGFLARLAATGIDVRLAALCDRREERIVRRGLGATHLEQVGVHVCVEDLEDELIRAVGAADVERLFDAEGDLASFRSMQRQPAWRGRAPDAQMRRFLGSGSRRKLRYAQLLVEAAACRDAVPRPLRELLEGL
jgi:hypothetical protein